MCPILYRLNCELRRVSRALPYLLLPRLLSYVPCPLTSFLCPEVYLLCLWVLRFLVLCPMGILCLLADSGLRQCKSDSAKDVGGGGHGTGETIPRIISDLGKWGISCPFIEVNSVEGVLSTCTHHSSPPFLHTGNTEKDKEWERERRIIWQLKAYCNGCLLTKIYQS